MASDDELGIVVRIKEVARAVRESERIKHAIKSIGDSANKSNKELASMSRQGLQQFSGLGRGVASVSSGMAQYARYATAAGVAATGFGLKTAAGLEGTNVALKQLMGSQAKATEFTNQLQDFAQNTPFQFTDVMKNAQQMIAKGFKPDETVSALTAIGNAASGLNAGQEGVDGISRALGQMRMKAKLSAEEVNGQLAEWGVNGWKYLAEAAGKSISQVQQDSQDGLIGGAAASNVILKGLQKEYDGMMNAQSKTLQGRWSNFIDKMKRSLYKVDANGKEGGIMAPLLMALRDDILPRAATLADKLAPKAERAMARAVGMTRYLARGYKIGGMEGLVESFGNLVGVGDRLVPIWRHLRDDSKLIGAIFMNSVWPAIRNVAIALGPVLAVALRLTEGVLKWMADHPDAAAKIFTGLGAALAVWGISSTLLGIAGALATVTKGFAAASGAASLFAAVTGTGAAAAAVKAADDKFVRIGPDTGKTATPGSGVAPKGNSPGRLQRWGKALLGGVKSAGPGVAWNYLNSEDYKNSPDSAENIAKRLSDKHPGRAGGGPVSATGVYKVGEQGPELVRLPGGSAVMNNKELMASTTTGNSGKQVRIEKGAITISGTDVLNNEAVANILLRQIEDRLARQ